MITKYIGSVREFTNCESIALVNVVNGVTLVESEIPKYTPTNIYFSRVKLVSRDNNGEFISRFTREEQIGFVVNYVIMYNPMGSPIGFTNLTQEINLYKYNIESITVSFDFTVVNKVSNLSVEVNYTAHDVLTKHREAHLSLFDRGESVTKSDVNIKSREGYAINYLHSFRNKDIVYRYSGKLSQGDSYFDHENWIINKKVFDEAKSIEMINIEGLGRSVVTVYDDRIKIFSKTTNSNYYVKVDSSMCVGSNMIVVTNSDGSKEAIPIHGLINMDESPFQTSCYTEPLVLEPKPINVSDFNIAKNPIDKSISLYKTLDNGIKSGDKDLVDTLSIFGSPKFYREKLVYYYPGNMIMTAKLDSDGKIESISYFTLSLPWKKTNKGLVPGYDDSEIENMEKSKLLNRICKGTYLSDIIFISKDLFIVNNSPISYKDLYADNKIKYDNEDQDVLTKYPDNPPTEDEHVYFITDRDYRRKRGSNRYMVECASDFNYEEGYGKSEYSLKIRPFVGERTGLRNLDKVSISARYDLRDKTIVSSYEGNLYSFIDLSDKYYRFGRL